ncbi:MAG: GyrI-like domain-containing protein [Myxococcota bacterium]
MFIDPSRIDTTALREAQRHALLTTTGDHRLVRLPPGANPDGFVVRMRELPRRHVAYLRVFDPYQGGVLEAAEQLVTWATDRGLEGGTWLGYMWDDPEVVALPDCRYDVGVVIPDVPTDGDVGRIVFPPMTVAEVVVRGDIALEQRALDWLFGTWLPASGLLPDDQPAFEAWHGLPFAHGVEHYELTAQLPVRAP